MAAAAGGARAAPGLQYLAWYREMRESRPVWRDLSNDFYKEFRCADDAAIIADHHAYLSYRRVHRISREHRWHGPTASRPTTRPGQSGVYATRHRPKALRIRAISEELLDPIGRRGKPELIDDFAYPLPAAIIAY